MGPWQSLLAIFEPIFGPSKVTPRLATRNSSQLAGRGFDLEATPPDLPVKGLRVLTPPLVAAGYPPLVLTGEHLGGGSWRVVLEGVGGPQILVRLTGWVWGTPRGVCDHPLVLISHAQHRK